MESMLKAARMDVSTKLLSTPTATRQWNEPLTSRALSPWPDRALTVTSIELINLLRVGIIFEHNLENTAYEEPRGSAFKHGIGTRELSHLGSDDHEHVERNTEDSHDR